MTIGFNAVASLAAGKVDAATGFWNAEGVALRRQGVPIRVFKVDRYGAPPYPELILTDLAADARTTTPSWSTRSSPRPAAATNSPRNTRAGARRPARGRTRLDRAEQEAQLKVLLPTSPRPFDPRSCDEWAAWDLEHGLLERAARRRSGLRPQSLSSRSTSAGSSRAIRERGTTRSTPAASAASWSRRRRASSSRAPAPRAPTSASGFSTSRSATIRSAPSSGASAARRERRPRGRRRSAPRRPGCRASGRWRC